MIGPPRHLFQAFRYSGTLAFRGSTLSYCNYNGKLYVYGLEDEFRGVKVMGETRIPAKMYKLGIKDNVNTDKTKAYRKKYSWFDRHIQIMDVENFTNVYIHIGNWDVDTDACYLLGNRPNINTIERGKIQTSTVAFKRFYQFVFPLLLAGEDVYFEFIDMDR